MARGLFVCGTDHEAGSSVVSLGLYSVLRKVVRDLGFFKPICNGPDDVDVAVMRSAFGLPERLSETCSVEISVARELVAHKKQDELLSRVACAFQRIDAESELVLIEGINQQRAASAFDMEINEVIAAHLGCPVLLVARGGADRRTNVERVVTAAITARNAFVDHGAEVLGVVVNRIEDDGFEKVRAQIVEAFQQAELPLYGVMPSLPYLRQPKLDQIAAELGATVLTGADAMDNVVAHTLIAAMSPKNFVKHLGHEKTLVITPGDREAILLAIACARSSSKRGSVSGVILTGGFEPDIEIVELLDEMNLPPLPLLAVKEDTFTTATRVEHVERRIRPTDRDKINTAVLAVKSHVQHDRLWEALEMPRPARRKVGPEAFLEEILDRARQSKRRVVLPEGDEPRTLKAVGRLQELSVCPVILLGEKDKIAAAAREQGVTLGSMVEVVDPQATPNIDAYVATVVDLRRAKRGGMTPEIARAWLDESRIHLGTLMVKHGDADGLVAGAVHATSDTVRPALQIIRVRPEIGVASSVFFMALKERVLVYGDCAIVPDPNAEELAAIAISAAGTARAFGIEPRVAMLSYSTGSSGSGESVDKVVMATQLVKSKHPDFLIDGPLQYDAAIDPSVGRLKQPNSPVAGRANVFIFPDLNAGNIAYKAVQRSADAIAVGPVLQGLMMPVNDLSRGCTVDDIVYTVAVTAIQAGQQASGDGSR